MENLIGTTECGKADGTLTNLRAVNLNKNNFINLISSEEDNDGNNVIIISSDEDEKHQNVNNMPSEIFSRNINRRVSPRIIHVFPNIGNRRHTHPLTELCNRRRQEILEPGQQKEQQSSDSIFNGSINIQECSLDEDERSIPRSKVRKRTYKKRRSKAQSELKTKISQKETVDKIKCSQLNTSTLFPTPINCAIEVPEGETFDDVTFYWNSNLSATSYWSNYNLKSRPSKCFNDFLSPGDAKILLQSSAKLIPTRRRKLEKLAATKELEKESYQSQLSDIANLHQQPMKVKAKTFLVKINKNLAATVAKTADPFLPKKNLHKIFNSSEVSETRRMKKSKSAREEYLPFDEESRDENSDIVNPVCKKSYCYLGCVCQSLKTSREDIITLTTHCRKPTCVLQCFCYVEKPASEIIRHSYSMTDQSASVVIVTENALLKEPSVPLDTSPLKSSGTPKNLTTSEENIVKLDNSHINNESEFKSFKVIEVKESEIPEPDIDPKIATIFQEICTEFKRDFLKSLYLILLNDTEKAKVFSGVKCTNLDLEDLVKNFQYVKDSCHITKLSTGKFVMITPKSVLNENYYEVFVYGYSRDIRFRTFTGKFLKCSKQYQTLMTSGSQNCPSKETSTIKIEQKRPDKLPIANVSQNKKTATVFTPVHTGISSLNNFSVKYANELIDKENDKLPFKCSVSSNFTLLEQVNINGGKIPHLKTQIVNSKPLHLPILKPKFTVLPSTSLTQIIALPHQNRNETQLNTQSEVSWEEAMTYVSSSEEDINSSQ